MKRLARLSVLAMIAGIVSVPTASHAVDHTYITMSDGVKISVAINYPAGFSPDDVEAWPTLFQMDGYGAGGGGGIGTASYEEKYVTVYASIRGTGCSGGRFDLFDRIHAKDGYDIIEGWIVEQPWSNGKVGIIGHSYPGLTGFLVASTSPPHLEAIAISGLIDDLYRGIVYPGGVPNYGFPAVWTGGYRPASELSGNAGRYVSETTAGDPTCLANIATRPPRDPFDDPIVQGFSSQEDDTWWAVRSTSSYLHGIKAPIHITQQYQDEQTGPRGGHVLWQRITGVPKRLALTNGVHATTGLANADKRAWLDCYINDNCVGDIDDPSRRVRLFFETTSNTTRAPEAISSDWPLPEEDVDWVRYYLGGDGSLTDDVEAVTDGDLSYVHTPTGRQMTADSGMGFGDDGLGTLTFFEGPDEARYELDFGADTAIAGPIALTLHATSTAADTDFFVDVLDVNDATGETTYLQRGMLRASHRALNELRTDYVDAPGDDQHGALLRPYHPHTSPVPIVPGTAYEYQVEVFPLGHVFRQGHTMVVSIHSPPLLDPLSIYAWVSGTAPALNTIHQADGMRSSILLPVMRTLPSVADAAPACGAMVGNPCFTPVL